MLSGGTLEGKLRVKAETEQAACSLLLAGTGTAIAAFVWPSGVWRDFSVLRYTKGWRVPALPKACLWINY